MEFRKNEKSNLENRKFIFTLAGVLLILSLTYAGFNVKSFIDQAYEFQMEVQDDLAELPPVTTPPPPPPPPPPPSKPPVEPELEIVEDEVELEEPEFEEDIEDMEIDMDATIEETGDDEVVEDVPMTFVKDMPHFKECSDLSNNMERDRCTRKLLNQKISEGFVMPEIAREMGYSGTVFVKFIVSKSGKVTNIEVIKGVNKVLDNAAIDAVSKLPDLIPGKNLDKPVSVIYQVPVRISIQ